jgi:hypothetical protein
MTSTQKFRGHLAPATLWTWTFTDNYTVDFLLRLSLDLVFAAGIPASSMIKPGAMFP